MTASTSLRGDSRGEGEVWASGLYDGRVMHERLRPRRHRLSYRIFQMLLDLDELPALGRSLRLFAHNGPGLLSFHDRDHGDGSGRPLRAWVEGELAVAGIDLNGGPIRLLCMPRVLGWAFNPLSLYFCHRPDGALAVVLYQVNNTFGQRHSYLIPVESAAGPTVRQGCEKLFYVSPFMDMRMSYAFDIRPPGEDVFVGVRTSDQAGPMLLATFTGQRQALSDGAILATVLGHPLLALKVVGGIHWEALKLWLKGVKLRPRPPAPAEAVTVVSRPAMRKAA